MRVAQLEIYKRRLLEMEDRLHGDADRIINSIPDEVNSPGNLSNVPTHNADNDAEMFETDIELARNQRGLESQVQEALMRIESGSFGVCEDCGKEIPAARLEAIPYTTLCKECAEKAEPSA